jgi:hypothetical protein
LVKNQKKKWPTFPILLGIYTLLNAKHAQKEVDQLDGIWLAQGDFKKHDPTKVVKKHCVMVKRKAYIHEDNPFDIIFQRATSFHEISQRVDAIRNNSNFLNFIEWKVKRKKYFLKEKNIKQGIEEIEEDDDEDEDKSSKSEHKNRS